ncbi:transmembrane ascorbate-dependent reductase CYB561-like isoform X2 [Paramacrobiotus metropolitanus]|uniref:transmembrane ascorbate-dependent reductase CYB561-like isoform X2 n=1 Tax=Paramacrobiotus metropolitanus TaxID=2943436 RepID=UPI0024460B23|nr:transmembrane ascorbate-dependent reductase CYB561-like isoform X2 [Paramacrobiotus metropolitanus]
MVGPLSGWLRLVGSRSAPRVQLSSTDDDFGVLLHPWKCVKSENRSDYERLIEVLMGSAARIWHDISVLYVANLAYRLLRGERKIRIKIIHAAMQLLAFIFMVIALQAVFDSHNNHRNSHGQPDPHPNMFSMHSWIGISTIVLYCCQWLTGFLFFLFPKVSLSLRRSYLPIHVFFGVLIHILFVSTALMGLTEAAIWNVKPDYHDKNGEAALVNILAIILVLFGLNGVYILINPNFKRQPRPDDDGAYIPRD